MAEADDRLLLKRLHNGDEVALAQLLSVYHRPLHDFLFRLTDNPTLADDLTQEVFIRLLQHPPTVNNLRAWLFTVGRNLVYDYFRSATYRREDDTELETLSALDDTDPLPEEHAILREERKQVAVALQDIPPEQREVVVLRYYHDLTLPEIADITGVPLGTAKSRLFHGLKKLKLHFKQELEPYE